jgi:hypothetical protein
VVRGTTATVSPPMTSRKLLFSVTTGDDLACVGHADLDLLVGDLNTSAAGDPPLHP